MRKSVSPFTPWEQIMLENLYVFSVVILNSGHAYEKKFVLFSQNLFSKTSSIPILKRKRNGHQINFLDIVDGLITL